MNKQKETLRKVVIVGAILRDANSVLTVSTLLRGEYGLEQVCLSVPCIVSKEGVAHVAEAKLPPEELQALEKSANVLKEALHSLASTE